jgi:lysophospholipase L1-like esterase
MSIILDLVAYLVHNPEDLLVIAFIGLLTVILSSTGHTVFLLLRNKIAGLHAKPFSQKREGGKRILIVGDSTAVGTGADRPEDSIAGRLGRDFPTADIVNLGENGAYTRAVLKQLDRAGDRPYDLVILSSGGNDILHFNRLQSLRRVLSQVIDKAKQKTVKGDVIMLFYSNIGIAPIFAGPIRLLYGKRTEKVRDIFQEVAAEKRISYVDLFTKPSGRTDNPFTENPRKYYAPDLIHPSSEGYHVWYTRMWLILSKIKIIS